MFDIPTLSFCITCKNRFYQIEQTLKKNLDDNRMFKHLIEFVLIDFGSTDGLQEWIKNNFSEEIDAGYLKYFYTNEMENWHVSIAKNTAHLMAVNDIVVNLDCDNFTGCNGGRFLIQHFLKNKVNTVIQQYGGDPYDGSFGRISVYRHAFIEVGGYDESFEPMGVQDLDLIERLKKQGYQYLLVNDPSYNRAVFNTKEVGVCNTKSHLKWYEMVAKNSAQSGRNLAEGYLIANNGYLHLNYNLSDMYGNKIVFK